MKEKLYSNKKVFSGLDALPQEKATGELTKGCIGRGYEWHELHIRTNRAFCPH